MAIRKDDNIKNGKGLWKQALSSQHLKTRFGETLTYSSCKTEELTVLYLDTCSDYAKLPLLMA